MGGTKFMVAAAEPNSLAAATIVKEATPAGLEDGIALLHAMIARVTHGAPIAGNAIRRIYGKPAEELDPAEWAKIDKAHDNVSARSTHGH